MILLELFGGVYQTRRLDDREAVDRIVNHGGVGDPDDVVFAEEIQLPNKMILVWFSRMNQGYACTFAEESRNPRDYRFKFAPTGTGNEFKVYGAVAQIIRDFIDEVSPAYVSMEGHTPRQSAIYARAIRRVQLPGDYTYQIDGSEVLIYDSSNPLNNEQNYQGREE